MKLFENKVLMRVFGPMRREVAGHTRTLCDQKVPNLYSSPDYIIGIMVMKDELSGSCSTHGGKRKMCQIFFGKPVHWREGDTIVLEDTGYINRQPLCWIW